MTGIFALLFILPLIKAIVIRDKQDFCDYSLCSQNKPICATEYNPSNDLSTERKCLPPHEIISSSFYSIKYKLISREIHLNLPFERTYIFTDVQWVRVYKFWDTQSRSIVLSPSKKTHGRLFLIFSSSSQKAFLVKFKGVDSSTTHPTPTQSIDSTTTASTYSISTVSSTKTVKTTAKSITSTMITTSTKISTITSSTRVSVLTTYSYSSASSTSIATTTDSTGISPSTGCVYIGIGSGMGATIFGVILGYVVTRAYYNRRTKITDIEMVSISSSSKLFESKLN